MYNLLNALDTISTGMKHSDVNFVVKFEKKRWKVPYSFYLTTDALKTLTAMAKPIWNKILPGRHRCPIGVPCAIGGANL